MGCRRAKQVFNRRWWFSRSSLSDSCDSVHGISQTRILEWVAISFSTGSCRPRDRTQVSCITGVFSTHPRDSRAAPQDVPRPERAGSFDPAAPPQPRFTPRVRNGGRVREDAAVVCTGGFRLRSARGLAGKPAAAALPGLEEEEAARQASGDAEEAGSGLRPPPCWSPPTPARPPRGHLACPVRGLGHSQARLTPSARSARLVLELVSSIYSSALRGDFGDRPIACGKGVSRAPERRESSVFRGNAHFGAIDQFSARV